MDIWAKSWFLVLLGSAGCSRLFLRSSWTAVCKFKRRRHKAGAATASMMPQAMPNALLFPIRQREMKGARRKGALRLFLCCLAALGSCAPTLSDVF